MLDEDDPFVCGYKHEEILRYNYQWTIQGIAALRAFLSGNAGSLLPAEYHLPWNFECKF